MSGKKYAVRSVTRGLLVISLLAVLSLSVISAQSLANKVDVGFQFTAGGQDLPAGSYRVKMAKDDSGQVKLILLGQGTETHLPVITRLASVGGPTRFVQLVFDSSEDKRTLSEVWLPMFDGFLVSAAQGQHDHDVVDEAKNE